MPQLTAAEWALLREGLAALAPERLREIGLDVAALVSQPLVIQHARPVICPLLDRVSGVCPVYAQRPVACRTYGFYVQRELGLYCSDIESRVAAGALTDVVWGNQDAIDRSDQPDAGLSRHQPQADQGRTVEQYFCGAGHAVGRT